MAYRAVFSAQYGYPSGIDIGLSAGIASVGIFGHGGIAKATAFSATPGIARRLQEVAKRLGALHGLEERVVMSAEFSALLGETRSRFTELILGDAFKVKDLESASVYVWPKIDSFIGQNSVPGVDVSAA
jgi:class 3 adenylate cyclase